VRQNLARRNQLFAHLVYGCLYKWTPNGLSIRSIPRCPSLAAIRYFSKTSHKPQQTTRWSRPATNKSKKRFVWAVGNQPFSLTDRSSSLDLQLCCSSFSASGRPFSCTFQSFTTIVATAKNNCRLWPMHSHFSSSKKTYFSQSHTDWRRQLMQLLPSSSESCKIKTRLTNSQQNMITTDFHDNKKQNCAPKLDFQIAGRSNSISNGGNPTFHSKKSKKACQSEHSELTQGNSLCSVFSFFGL